MTQPTETPARRVAVVTLGCSRNEVDSEELAGRLAADGWALVADPAEADVALVNTCGFVEQAKKDSIDALLEAADLKDGSHRTQAVVAVGCLAERYGSELAEQLPEADAVLGFDSYAALSGHLRAILAGSRPASHTPADRRMLLPLTPVDRAAAAAQVSLPGHGTTGGDPTAYRPMRALLEDRPWAPLKIASGCDRRCAFCAIPAFRGSFVSRPIADVVGEARWLAEQGVREVFLVSENSTSYGKDFGDLAALEKLLPQLTAVDGIDRVRVSYLQPAEIRPGLLEVMASTPGVMPYYDISFQHSASGLLRRMRRFGGTDAFLDLIARVRSMTPEAGIRSNVIVGFPGETEAELGELELFLAMARLDVVGVFGYSDEDGTEAESLPDHLDTEVVTERVARVTDLVEQLTAQRAEERIGSEVTVLIEAFDDDEGMPVGRAEFQGPEVDGVTSLPGADVRVGDIVPAIITTSEGIDLVAAPR
ncbi:MAG: 30S ribosomal protein S12 methylthiotransferase RimO [Actinomycetales bacterium]|jgi:ribosomal protein S12 methylthiotransferase RimO|nr:30S ribosomal protein S12 methylthiotransferase RimO [Actinomycetales bacterium]HMT32719.1 30S ribosomal protein S12 methylthiotransferase RimO [Dermatophilaceae bacterium]